MFLLHSIHIPCLRQIYLGQAKGVTPFCVYFPWMKFRVQAAPNMIADLNITHTVYCAFPSSRAREQFG